MAYEKRVREVTQRPKVAIAGASGFVGSHLRRALQGEYRVVNLARRRRETADSEWRACDLFSANSTFAALEGVDVAIYLVHSMMPSTSLFQGSFHDTDLLLADNFARACAKQKVKQILYLGGLIPESGFVSAHLASRREVEVVLQSSGAPVTCLRAGMVVGPEGSSFQILKALVARLPWMILPKWTQSLSQAVYIDDVVSVLKAAILNPVFTGKTLNLVNGESLTYEGLLRQTAEAMGKKRAMVRVPIASTGFSKRWVQLFSGASHELVSPLIDSLQCDLPQVDPPAELAGLIRYPTFKAMLERTLVEPSRGSVAPTLSQPVSTPGSGSLHTVRSIQRLPPVRDRDTRFIATEYIEWLPRAFGGIVRVTREAKPGHVAVHLVFLSRPLLVLEQIESGPDHDRTKFHIVAGTLSKTTSTGWLEFRQVAGRRFTLVSIHEFVPSVPWLIYRVTQAPLHALVMRRFGQRLERLGRQA